MLIKSRITDLLTGHLSDQDAYQVLLDLSRAPLDASVLKECVDHLRQNNKEYAYKEHELIDCCGTGGSGLPHFNTSTAVAFVLAAGGIKVAKFGNRSVTGRSGSFDFLEYLKVPVISNKESILNLLDSTNLVFLYAGDFYPNITALSHIRKAIGHQTIINFIAPLLNPLNPGFRLLGTSTRKSQIAIANYLNEDANNKCSFVVHCKNGLDELCSGASNHILQVDNQGIKEKELSFTAIEQNFIRTMKFTPQENVSMFNEVINNFDSAPVYIRSLITLNAGAGFLVFGKVKNLGDGKDLAKALLISGAVREKVNQCRRIYAKYSK
jgi:anthranilate phosphoribosyltransferase